MDSLPQFAYEARAFTAWATQCTLTESEAAREALVRILSLFAAALQLPPFLDNDLQNDADILTRSDTSTVIAYRTLPFDMYSEVFDPMDLGTQEPVIGSLADDVLDIYRDIATGLVAYECGDILNARWEWGFGFAHHWGEHATGAIRALQAWLSQNAIDRLSKKP